MVGGVAAIAGVAEQLRALGRGPRAAAHHRGAVQQSQQLGGGWGVVGQPAQGGLHQVGGGAQPAVVGGLGGSRGNRCPTLVGAARSQ